MKSSILIAGICLAIVMFIFSPGLEAQAVEGVMSFENMQCQCTCSGTMNSDQELIINEQEPKNSESVEVGEVLISEFVADPVAGQKEWVELYNTTASPVDLEDWVLVEGSGRQTLLNGVIEAKGYKVFEKSSLNNSGDIIILKSPIGIIIDQVSYGDWDDGDISNNAPTAPDPYSVIRVNVNQDSDIDSDDFALTTFKTKGAENVLLALIEDDEPDESEVEVPLIDAENDDQTNVEDRGLVIEDIDDGYDLSTEVGISEFLPNPQGTDAGQEWVELFNAGAVEVNLKSWQIDDEAGGSLPFTITEDLIILPQDYVLLNNDLTKVVLNNTVDSIRLFDPEGKLIDQVGYDGCKEGYSYALIENEWQWTAEPTPLAKNVIVESSVADKPELELASLRSSAGAKAGEFIKATLSQVRQLPLKTKVQVSGLVSVEPDIFSNKTMYLSGSGIQVYNSKADWPEIKQGQEVEVIGTLSQNNDEHRILVNKAEDIKVINVMEKDLEPTKINSEQVGEEKEGFLVEITGELVKKNNSRLIFADEFGEFTVYLKQKTGLKNKDYDEGKKYQIVGILGQYLDEYRIMPRSKADLSDEVREMMVSMAGGQIEMSQTVLPGQKSNRVLLFLLIILGVLSVGLLGLGWYYREKVLAFWAGLRLKKKDSG